MSHVKLRVHGVNQHQNKEKRISGLEPLITNGYLLFADTLPERFISQLHLFPTSHDDGPDALQGAIAQLQKQFDNDVVGAPISTGGRLFDSPSFENPSYYNPYL